MARHDWHKMPKMLRERGFLSLTAAARGVLLCVRELLHDDGILEGSVSNWASWMGLDRKTTREGLEAIAQAGVLKVTTRDEGKAGVIYTVATLDQVLTNPQATPKQPSTNPQADPNHGPHKSANDAGFRQPSLIRREETRPEEKRAAASDAHAREAIPQAPRSPLPPLAKLEDQWGTLRGRVGPCSPRDLEAMREALALPGMHLEAVMAAVDRVYESRKKAGSPPSSWTYFLPALKDDSARLALRAAPVPTGQPARAAPNKPKIRDRAHYEALADAGFDPADWANPEEFAG